MAANLTAPTGSKTTIEIEITCLVKELPSDYRSFTYHDIQQGYFSTGSDALRIRKKGERFELTKKEPVTAGDLGRFEEVTILIKEEVGARVRPGPNYSSWQGVKHRVCDFDRQLRLSDASCAPNRYKRVGAKSFFRLIRQCRLRRHLCDV